MALRGSVGPMHADGLDGVLPADNRYAEALGDIIDKVIVQRLALVLGVVLFGERAALCASPGAA